MSHESRRQSSAAQVSGCQLNGQGQTSQLADQRSLFFELASIGAWSKLRGQKLERLGLGKSSNG